MRKGYILCKKWDISARFDCCSDRMSDVCEDKEREQAAAGQHLHPILVNSSSEGGVDDPFYKLGPMRPRANTDPTAPRPRLKVHFDLPDIIVDDCSDEELEKMYSPDVITNELANTAQGAFFVYTSPPRQRSNTCPSNMFRRKTIDRPPTPPPSDKIPKDGVQRHIGKDRVSFSPHVLSKVAEDVPDLAKTVERKGAHQKTSSPTRSRKATHIPGTSTSEGRQSRNVAKSLRPNLDSPTASPKRAGAKQTNVHNHRTTNNKSIRDVIHSTA